jgi:hypothetical protein
MHDAWLAKSILKCIAAKSYEAWGKLKAIKSSQADSCVSLRRLIEFCRHENFSLSLSPTALQPGVGLGLLQNFPPSFPV